MRPRLAACLLALCCAFATASPLPAPVSVLSRSLLSAPEAHFSSHELVLRAHRAGLTRGLQEEFLCTSLSGPACLSGAAHQPDRWTRVRNDSVRPAYPPVAEVFLLADARTLLALLSTGADWLVLFYAPDCEECEAAAHAVRAAAPALALRSPLRYLAVDCAAESALATCAAHGVTRTPQLHLYLGQPRGVTFHSTPFQPVRTGEQAGPAEGWTAEAVLQFESNGRSPSRQVRAAARAREKGGDIINLKVKGQDNTEVHFRVRANTAFKRIFEAYCTKKSITCDYDYVVRFLFDGQEINHTATPNELEMEDGDTIHAIMVRYDDEEEGDDDDEEDEGVSQRPAVSIESIDLSVMTLERWKQLLTQGLSGAGLEEWRQSWLKVAEQLNVAQAEVADAAAAAAAQPPPPPSTSPGQLRSIPSRTRRRLELVNSRSSPFEVFWLDFTGVERRFALVQPGRTATMSTFTSHLWVVREARSGEHLALVSVTGGEGGQRVIIT